MKNKVFIVVFVLFTIYATSSNAQFNPFTNETKLVSVGFGASGWGIPLFLRYEQAVADNITVGGNLSFQSKTEKYAGFRWNHTIVGVNARGSYHFNELFDVPEEWDFYGGGSLGYYFWNTKIDGSGAFPYSGSGSGGFNIGGHIGGRYFVNEKLGIMLELGGGSVLAGGTVGVTFLL